MKCRVAFANSKKEFFSKIDKTSGRSKSVFVVNSIMADEKFFKDKNVIAPKKVSFSEIDKTLNYFNKNQFLPDIVFGIGGGRILDFAKYLAYKHNAYFVSCPTSFSQDGIYSGVCVIEEKKGKRKTTPAKFPDLILTPFYLVKKAPITLTLSGMCEVLTNIIVLQDISLAKSKGKVKNVDKNKIQKILQGISNIIENFSSPKNERSLRALFKSLIIAGSLMEKDSYYASQSEHEVEKVLYNTKFLHGQLVGFGALVSAKIYERYSNKFQKDKLFIPPENLFELIKELFCDFNIYNFCKKPLQSLSEEEIIRRLKRVSKERPERFNLWNIIDSRKVPWQDILKEI